MRSQRNGFVLVAALWITVIVSGLALAVSAHFRATMVSATGVIEYGIARRSALAGVARALRDAGELLTAAEQGDRAELVADPWRPASRSWGCFQDGELQYCLEVVAGEALLNVNLSSAPAIERLLVGAGVAPDSAIALAAAIMDWIDADDMRRRNGAEAADYPPYASLGNRPLASVRELRGVRGFDATIAEWLEPLVSTRGGQQVHLAIAPRPVLASLPGFGSEVLDAVESLRRAGSLELPALLEALHGTPRDSLEAHLPELMTRVTTRVSELVIRSVGRAPGGTTVTAEALVVQGDGRPRVIHMVIL